MFVRDREPGMMGHFHSLIPGRRSPQLLRESANTADVHGSQLAVDVAQPLQGVHPPRTDQPCRHDLRWGCWRRSVGGGLRRGRAGVHPRCTGSRLRTFRYRGAGSLRRNWIVVTSEPFVATLLGLVAAVTATTAGRPVAPWLFELAVILLAHAATRLVWILHELVRIVAVDDALLDQKDKEIPLERIFPSRRS